MPEAIIKQQDYNVFSVSDTLKNERLSLGKLIEIVDQIWPNEKLEYIEIFNTGPDDISVRRTNEPLEFFKYEYLAIEDKYKLLKWQNNHGRLSLDTMKKVASKEFPKKSLHEIKIYDCKDFIVIAAFLFHTDKTF